MRLVPSSAQVQDSSSMSSDKNSPSSPAVLLHGAGERMEWQRLGSCAGCKVSSAPLMLSPALSHPSRVDSSAFLLCLLCPRGRTFKRGLDPECLGYEVVWWEDKCLNHVFSTNEAVTLSSVASRSPGKGKVASCFLPCKKSAWPDMRVASLLAEV